MYPLNNDPNESERLNTQLDLLKGDLLVSLFKEKMGNVLDVGCGTGHLYKNVPQDWKYIGIDTIDRFEKLSSNHHFIKQDILTYTSELKYDVIICRLVLWSLPRRDLILENLRKMSHAKTLLYCYEPDDRHLAFGPELQSMTELALNWQQTVIPQGSNPFIGGDLEEVLDRNSWKVLAHKVHNHGFSATDPEYQKHLENLIRIFSQSTPAPVPELVEAAKASIKIEGGNFKERYVEVIGSLK
jgi:SAM-dependent methyltransferase